MVLNDPFALKLSFENLQPEVRADPRPLLLRSRPSAEPEPPRRPEAAAEPEAVQGALLQQPDEGPAADFPATVRNICLHEPHCLYRSF